MNGDQLKQWKFGEEKHWGLEKGPWYVGNQEVQGACSKKNWMIMAQLSKRSSIL